MFVFFFFKQKTAYEMRISDWSSDVCSSDLPLFLGPGPRRDPQRLARQPVIEPLERPRRRRQPGDRAEIERRRFARERPAIVERPATVALHLLEFDRGIEAFALVLQTCTAQMRIRADKRRHDTVYIKTKD